MMANVYVIGPLIMWLIAQFIKFTINLIRGQADIRYLFAAGGMPSAHAAVVCSLAMIALLDQGWSSPIFGLAAVFAAIVMYDSFGVRRSSGEQARLLNRLTWDLQQSGALRTSADYTTLREILGHKPFEVAAGAALGIVGGVVIEWSKVTAHGDWLGSRLDTFQLQIYSYIILAALVGGIAVWWWARTKLHRVKSARKPLNRLLAYGLIGVTVLVLEVFCAYQQLPVLQTRITAILILIIILAALASLYGLRIKQLLVANRQTPELERRERWLKKAKRR